jgi:hypothetical protein
VYGMTTCSVEFRGGGPRPRLQLEPSSLTELHPEIPS